MPVDEALPKPPGRRGRGFSLGSGKLTETLLEHARDAVEAARAGAQERAPQAAQVARSAASRVRDAVDQARPEASRLAKQARAAAEAARPRVEQAARDATEFAREHESQIRGGAKLAARVAVPAPLRTVIDVLDRAGESDTQRDPEGSGSAKPKDDEVR